MSAAGTAPEGIDKDIWETMSDEERSGIAGTDYTPGELESIKKLATANPGSDDDDDDDKTAEAAAAAAAAAAEAAAAAAAAKPGDKKDDDPAAAAAAAAAATATEPDQAAITDPVAPVYKAKLPDDFDSRVKAVTDKEAAAWEAFEAGDKTRDQLQAELATINAERDELNRLKTKVEVSEEMSAQTDEARWQAAIVRNMVAFSKPENGGIDYRKDPGKLDDLNQFVKVLANNDANNDKPMDWFLTEAHKRVRALHGLAESAKPKADEKADPVAEAAARRKPDLKAVPQTLALVPGGDGPGDVGGEFAEIDQLEGDELESAIAAMTPEKRARFAAGR